LSFRSYGIRKITDGSLSKTCSF